MTNEQLAAAAQTGDRRALFDLWESVKPFCMKAAWHVYRQSDPARLAGRGVLLEDMQQETYFAFLEAVRGFDASTGYTFLTYMKYPLKNAFAGVLGYRRKPDPLDGSKRLDEPCGEDGQTPLSDLIEDPDAAGQLEDAEDAQYTQALRIALENAMREACDEEQRRTLKLRYYAQKTRRECALACGVEVAAVRRIEARGLQNLRRPDVARKLQGFLEEKAYSVSTSFGAWKEKGSNPERVAELLDQRAARYT